MSLSSRYTVRYLLAYAGLFLLFEGWGQMMDISYLMHIWYPVAGLHLGLALLIPPLPAGMAIAVAVSISVYIAPLALPVWGIPLFAILYAGLYVVAARTMQRYFFPPLASLQTARIFLLGALLLPLVVAFASVTFLATFSSWPFGSDAWLSAIGRWALGEAASILTVTPLVALLGWSMHPAYADRGISWIEWIPASFTDRVVHLVEWMLVPLALYLAFFLSGFLLPQYYICFVPVLWIALRHGLPASSAVVFAMALGISLVIPFNPPLESLIELQLFLVVLASAGLLVGMLISERNRAQSVLTAAGKRLRGYLPANTAPPAPSPRRPSASSAHVLEQSTALLTTTADQIAALNNELQLSQQQLRDALSASNRMMSILSHDLKNPLVGIRGLAEVLSERDKRTERESRMLRLIQQSSQQALDMVENLLLWSRLDTNKITLEQSRSSIHVLVNECFTLLGGAAQNKDIELVNTVSPTLQIYADPRMITIALRNLLSNAIKFTGQGGTATVTATPFNDDWVIVSVSDTGIGLEDGEQQRLFASSEARSAPGTEGELGTGLGLQLCQEMIQRHNGLIWVESAPNEGATFRFTVPRHSNAAIDSSPEEIKATASQGATNMSI